MRRWLAAALGVWAVGAAPAHAETFQVNTTQNVSGCTLVACSVRGALEAAMDNGNLEDDVINVPAGVYAVPELFLNQGVTRVSIVGAGANATFIQPSGPNRVLTVGPSASLAIANVTIRNGRPESGTGGNIAVQSTAELALDRVRITNGEAVAGGGISAAGALSLTIARSLIDGNTAFDGNGGGIWMPGETSSTRLTITDSTITANVAASGGAIASTFNAAETMTLRGVTVAFNRGGDVGGIYTQQTPVRLQGSLIAGNTAFTGATGAQQLSNCNIGGAVTDEGGNVEDADHCGLGAASLRSTDPGLATALDASQPPALAIGASSEAVDFADCAGRTSDQRGVPRPQGVRCDAGAFEYNPPPTTAVAGTAPPFTFSSNETGVTFECSLDGGPFVPCTSPFDPGAGPGTHTLRVRAVDALGLRDPNPRTVTFTVQPPVTPPSAQTPTPTPAPTVTPVPTPVVNRVIVARPTRGKVRIKRPGSKRYVTLDSTQGIPVGSRVDTRKGRVELKSIPRRGARPETATFYDGIFRLTQSKGITDLKLVEALAKCPRRGRAATAAKKPKKRKLWGNGKGSFRTTGKYSAATVRGTKWLVEDSCRGTLTRVKQGSVKVRHGKRTIILRAGKRYLARPR